MRRWQDRWSSSRLLVTGGLLVAALLGGNAPESAQGAHLHSIAKPVEHQAQSLTQFLNTTAGHDFSALLLSRLAAFRDSSLNAFTRTDKTATAIYQRWLATGSYTRALQDHGIYEQLPPERALSQWPDYLQTFVATYPRDTLSYKYLRSIVIDRTGTLQIIDRYGVLHIKAH